MNALHGADVRLKFYVVFWNEVKKNLMDNWLQFSQRTAQLWYPGNKLTR